MISSPAPRRRIAERVTVPTTVQPRSGVTLSFLLNSFTRCAGTQLSIRWSIDQSVRGTARSSARLRTETCTSSGTSIAETCLGTSIASLARGGASAFTSSAARSQRKAAPPAAASRARIVPKIHRRRCERRGCGGTVSSGNILLPLGLDE